MKRHFELADIMEFRLFIEEAVRACRGPHFAKGHFSHAGIAVNELKEDQEDDNGEDDAEDEEEEEDY